MGNCITTYSTIQLTSELSCVSSKSFRMDSCLVLKHYEVNEWASQSRLLIKPCDFLYNTCDGVKVSTVFWFVSQIKKMCITKSKSDCQVAVKERLAACEKSAAHCTVIERCER